MTTTAAAAYQEQLELNSKLTARIQYVQQESKSLINQLTKIKIETSDTTLKLMSNNVNHSRLQNIKYNNYNTLKGHFNKILTISWNPDNKHILSGSQDGFLINWDSTTGLKKNLIKLDDPYITSTDISPNGKLIGTGGLENACIIYKLFSSDDYTDTSNGGGDIQTKKSIVSIFKGHKEYISDLTFFNNNNNEVLTSSGDKTIILWDINKGNRLRTFYGHLSDVISISKSPVRGNVFLSCSSDKLINLWDSRKMRNIRQFQASGGAVGSNGLGYYTTFIKFLPNGETFAVGYEDGSIKLFDIRSDCQIGSFEISMVYKRFGVPKILSASLNNNHVIGDTYSNLSSSGNGNGGNVSIKSSSIKSSASSNLSSVLSIDFSKSGRLMFVSYDDFLNIVIWDTVTGEIVGSLDGHKDVVSMVKVSDDGMGIATGSRDFTTKIWSV